MNVNFAHNGRILLRGSVLTVLLITAISGNAATVTVTGNPGLSGLSGTMLSPDGGNGGVGDNAIASLSSLPLEGTLSATAFGGNGGAGGSGLLGGDGGHGGNGGTAEARADLTRTMPGTATVSTSATGGNGGIYGSTVPTGTSGVGGIGGDARAFGSASTPGADNVSVNVFSRGGQGGDSSAGISPDGGQAFIDGAFGSSAGGRVIVTAGAVSGNGGRGQNNTNGLIVGRGGRSPDVVLIDVVDGSTTGSLFLTQRATTGTAGSGRIPAAAGSAVSHLERTKNSIGLVSLTTESDGGNGASDLLGQGTSDGGNADARTVAINTLGAASAAARATGGDGGSNSASATALLNGKAVGDGGDAQAYAEADGVNGAVSVTSTAFGGRGGSLASLPDAPGSGGNAMAEAYGRHRGANRLTVSVIADGGWSGSPTNLQAGPFIASRGGSATAIAAGDSDAAGAAVDAFARGINTYNAGPALALARADALSGSVTARATSAQFENAFASEIIDVSVSGNIPGTAEVAASALHKGMAGVSVQQVAAQAGAAVGSRLLGGVLSDITLFAHADAGATGTQTFNMDVDITYLEDTGVPLSPLTHLMIDLTQFQIDAGGFDRIDFSARYMHTGTTVAMTLLTVADAIAFFSAPIDLGAVGSPFVGGGTLDLRIDFDITLSQPGQGIVLAAVPLPGALLLLSLPLAVLGRRRRGRG